jgi:hypothetical protein
MTSSIRDAAVLEGVAKYYGSLYRLLILRADDFVAE